MIYDLEGHQVSVLLSASPIVHPLDAHGGRIPVDEDDRDVLRSRQDVLRSSDTTHDDTVPATQV